MKKLKKLVYFSVVAVVFIMASTGTALAGNRLKEKDSAGFIADQQQINLQELYDVPGLWTECG